MQLILDNLLALTIACIVMLTLSAAQIRASQTGVEQVVAHAAKAKAISFGEWLEDDILSLGANFGSNRYRFEQPLPGPHGNTRLFTFYSDSIAAGGDTIRVMTRYRLVQTGTAPDGEGTRPLFEVQREHRAVPIVGGLLPPVPLQPPWLHDGASVATLAQFIITPLDRNGAPSSVETADYIKVVFSMVPEMLGDQGYLRELFWTTTLKVRPFWGPAPGGTAAS